MEVMWNYLKVYNFRYIYLFPKSFQIRHGAEPRKVQKFWTFCSVLGRVREKIAKTELNCQAGKRSSTSLPSTNIILSTPKCFSDITGPRLHPSDLAANTGVVQILQQMQLNVKRLLGKHSLLAAGVKDVPICGDPRESPSEVSFAYICFQFQITTQKQFLLRTEYYSCSLKQWKRKQCSTWPHSFRASRVEHTRDTQLVSDSPIGFNSCPLSQTKK
ncbi:Hypothetical_protein [Hexamita inflata]|uniref:Hypothetical_protein n=1 Tax=Hexamita inflata TaxID=28002 RepID=A0AA86QM07_9EUKA|nr:Hypothetical protein HINF_LOCUS49686 [Hexamita inflata]CAI9962059.1 Hypothetical protein HINF_LOCUS49704 [Hexamita inflata]